MENFYSVLFITPAWDLPSPCHQSWCFSRLLPTTAAAAGSLLSSSSKGCNLMYFKKSKYITPYEVKKSFNVQYGHAAWTWLLPITNLQRITYLFSNIRVL